MIRRGLTPMVAVIGLLLAAPGAYGQALFHGDDLAIYDSTDKRVGRLSNAGIPEVAFRTDAGRTVFVTVTPSRFRGTGTLYFPQVDCGGTPFITRAHREPSSSVTGPRQTVHVQTGTFARRTMRSLLMPDDGRCVNSTYRTEFARAAPAGIDLADYFTPPFALRATAAEAVPTGAAAEPEPLDPTDRLVAYDATGKRVGAAIGGGVSRNVVADVAVVTGSGMTLMLAVSDDSLDLGAGPHFESTDCTGPPFMFGSETAHGWGGLVHLTMAVGPRRAVYVRSGDATVRTMSSRAFHSIDGIECEILRTRAGIGWRGQYAPTEPIGLELVDYFTPPFIVRAGRATRPLPRP
jgi:hypothetical protein